MARPREAWQDVLDLACIFGGFAAMIYGLHCLYPPAAWIVGGGLILIQGMRK